WREGPGIVSRPDKHAVPSGSCGVVPVDVMHATGDLDDERTWDLAHVGADLPTGLGCDCLPAPRVFEGSLLAATGRPLALVQDGTRLQFQDAAPARWLARSSVRVAPEVFDAVPFGASLRAGSVVWGAPGRPAAFRLDGDRLWPIDCIEAITANGSRIA